MFVINELKPKNNTLVCLFYKKWEVCRRTSDQCLYFFFFYSLISHVWPLISHELFLTCTQEQWCRSQISRKSCSIPCDPLGSPPLILHLIHRPHGTFHVLHAHETLVQAQVVAHRVLMQRRSEFGSLTTHTATQNAYRVNHPDGRYLPSGSVASEISKRPCEPGVDLIEGKLPVWCFHNGLNGGIKLLLLLLSL